MRIQARAKINWTLDITGQREDGYHLMDMLMQPVTLHDIVTIEPAEAVTLTTSGQPLLPPDESHLALRAARALQHHTGCTLGAAIHVEKHIPAGAGMGGGSADAAAVLAGLNLLWHLGLIGEGMIFALLEQICHIVPQRPKRNPLNYCVLFCAAVMYFFLSMLFYFDPPYHLMIAFTVMNLNLDSTKQMMRFQTFG